MFKMVPTNQVTVEVTPSVPWLGQLTADQAYRDGQNIADQIRRHVDGYQNIYVDQKFAYVDSDGIEFETLYEALEYRFDAEGALETFEIRYERPSDNGVGSRQKTRSFQEVIEEAWKNPHKFEVVSGPKLTEAQEKFLKKVLEESLVHKAPAAYGEESK
ncbi:hypothetical protein J1TS5_26050 [Paenibacillus macerans]|uniref:hypothetical protein n=1 Tax=Paenibacillus macerans TaxID=44252 RepID=UPI001B26F71D|nr:hypothetical protein [Paenibacillus macerans]GIP10435.1 hypothetical protein J1TS5_26050 [Paenibacillus macerans]